MNSPHHNSRPETLTSKNPPSTGVCKKVLRSITEAFSKKQPSPSPVSVATPQNTSTSQPQKSKKITTPNLSEAEKESARQKIISTDRFKKEKIKMTPTPKQSPHYHWVFEWFERNDCFALVSQEIQRPLTTQECKAIVAAFCVGMDSPLPFTEKEIFEKNSFLARSTIKHPEQKKLWLMGALGDVRLLQNWRKLSHTPASVLAQQKIPLQKDTPSSERLLSQNPLMPHGTNPELNTSLLESDVPDIDEILGTSDDHERESSDTDEFFTNDLAAPIIPERIQAIFPQET